MGSAPAEEVFSNVIALTRVALELKLPVLVAEAPFGGPAATRPPVLTEALGEIAVMTHAFSDARSTVRPVFEGAGRTGLVFVGIATDVGWNWPHSARAEGNVNAGVVKGDTLPLSK